MKKSRPLPSAPYSISRLPEKLYAFMENSPAACWIKDADFRYVYCNPMWLKSFDMAPDKVLGKTDFDIWPKAVARQFRENDIAVFSTGRPVSTVEAAPVNGVLHQWLVSKCFFTGPSGRHYVGGQAFDYTPHQDPARHLNLQASLLEQVRNAVIVTDAKGRIIYWNRFAEMMYGWKAAEVLNKYVSDITVPRESKTLANGILAGIEKDGYWEGEMLLKRKDGTVFPAFVTDSLLRDQDGKVTGIIGISSDVTDYNAARRELEEKNIALKEVLSRLEIEKNEIRQQIMRDIDRVITPALRNIKRKAAVRGLKDIENYTFLMEKHLAELTAMPLRSESRFTRLTLKEVEVCNLVRTGLSNKEIASMLAISPLTVGTHRVRIRRKLGLKAETNLATYLHNA